MRWFAILAGFLVLTGSAMAAGSDEQYLDIYNEIIQADSLQQGGHPEAAALRYLQAQADLQKLQTDHPTWNPDIVKFRLDYMTEKLQELEKFLPSTNAQPAAVTAPAQLSGAAPPSATGPSMADLEQQNAGYQEQIRALTAANADLQGKLKEALSVQPAAVTPEELAKAQAKIVELQKERDLLAVALDQEKTSNARDLEQTEAETKKAQMELAMAKEAAAASETKLAIANKELDELKAARAVEADHEAAMQARTAADEKKAQDEMSQLKEAGAESDKILAAANKELELLKTTHPPEIDVAEGAKQMPEERDQLKQLLAEVSKDETEITELKVVVAEGEKNLAAANSELDAMKAARPPEAPPTADTQAIIAERDKLKEDLAQRSKDLADAEAHHTAELLNVRTALQLAEQQRDDLAKQLAAAPPEQPAAATNNAPTPVQPENPLLNQQVEQLQARVAVLEASPVPFTPDELALLKKPPLPAPDEIPKVEEAPRTGHIHSSKDLPPGSGALWEEALHASMAGDYDTAEQKYNEVLQQDLTNVYVLAFLANVQFAAGHLDACEKSVQRALAVDPDDPGSLYLLGLLRYRQDKLDEALDALSLSAKFNPTNAATQNFLGCVLADKGLRPAAETAMRKALQCDPDYADAHFNLAVVYAGNQPPSLELARWHYKRAVALGHAKSATLDKLLAEDKQAPAPGP